MAGAIIPAAAAVMGVGAYNKYQDGKQQQSQLLGRNIATNALLSGMDKQIPARAGIMQSGMTMGPDGPVFNPTQAAPTPARPAWSQDMQTKFAHNAAPELAMAQIMGRAFPAAKTKDDFVITPRGAMDVQSQQVVPDTGPIEKPDMGSDMWQDALRISGGNPEKAAQTLERWRNKPGTSITMGGDKAVTLVDKDRYKATSEQLAKLDTMAPGVDRMMAAIDAGAQTGFSQNWQLPVKQAIEELTGTTIPGTSEQEVFKSLQNYLGPNMRTPGSGSSSDTDVKMFVDSIPTLAKSEGGNKAIADYYGRIRNRTAQVAKIQQDLLREFEYIPVEEERKRVDALGPLFSADERARLKSTKPTTSSPSPERSVTVDGISGTFTGEYREGKPIYKTADGRPFVVN